MKKNIFKILVLFIFSTFIDASNLYEFGMKEICERVMLRSKDIKLIENDIDSAKITIKEAYSNLWPSVNANASYSMHEDEESIEFDGDKIVIVPKNSTNAGFSVEQPLFQFRVYHLGKAAKTDLKSLEHFLNYSRDEIIFKAVELYLNALSTKQNILILKESISSLTSHYSIVKEKFLLGEIPETILIEIEYELAKLESDLLSVESNFESIKDSLSLFIGSTEKFTLKELGLIQIENFDINKEEWILKARNNRSDIKQLNLKLESYDLLIKSVKMEYLPSFSAFFNVDYNFDTSAFNPAEKNLVGGISVNWPIWERGKRLIQIDKIKNAKENIKTQIDKIYEQVDISINECVRNIFYINKSQNSKQKQIKLGEKLLELRSEEFKLGVATAVDVSDANVFLLSAKKQYNIDIYNKYLSYFKLMKESGLFYEFLKEFYNIELQE